MVGYVGEVPGIVAVLSGWVSQDGVCTGKHSVRERSIEDRDLIGVLLVIERFCDKVW